MPLNDAASSGGATKDTPFKIRYALDATFFTGDGKTMITPVKIKSFFKEVDYTKLFTPIFTIIPMFTMSDLKILKDNEQNIICSVKLQKVKYNSPSGSSLDKTEVERTAVFETIFIPILESEDIKSFRDLLPKDDMTEYSSQDRSHNIFEVRVYLTSLSYNTMYKRNFNAILRGTSEGYITIGSALKYVCETCGVEKGYIIDMPDNDMVYHNIVIPPGNVKFTFDVLQLLYGVYMKDILTFYDLDGILYILSRLKDDHEYQKDAIRSLDIIINTDRNNSDPGTVFYKDGNKAVYSLYKGLEDKSISIASGEAYGDGIIFTCYGFGDQVFVYENGAFKQSNDPTREFLRNTLSHEKTPMGLSFEYDELNNAFNMFSTLEMLGIHTFHVLKTEGMDMDFLKPNVLFTVSVNSTNPTDSDKYTGKVFPIGSYKQEFFRDNDITSTNIFKSFETVILLDVSQQIIEPSS